MAFFSSFVACGTRARSLTAFPSASRNSTKLIVIATNTVSSAKPIRLTR